MTFKRLLALSSGGDRGAVLIGMLHGMYQTVGKKRCQWTQISGISAGSIVGALVSQTTPETFDIVMERARDMFELGGFHVVQPHTRWGTMVNAIDAMMYYSSLYSNEALIKLIDEQFSEDLMITPLTCGAYNKDTCEYETFTENLNRAIVASASVPIVFPPLEINGQSYQDGAMRHIIPVREIIEFLKSNRVCEVDVMICYPVSNRKEFFAANTPTGYLPLLEELFRTITDQMLSTMLNDLQLLANYLEVDVNELWRYPCNTVKKNGQTIRIYSPKNAKFTTFTDIQKEQMEEMYNDGKTAVQEYLKQ